MWQPLLSGDEADRVRATIDDIAEALRVEADRRGADSDPGLADGNAGLALFFAYLGAAIEDEASSDYARELLDRAIDGLAERPLPADFGGGFTGIGWAIEHLQDLLYEEEADEDDPIGESLAEMLERPVTRGEFDLITGLTGFGTYALEALPRPAARRCLDLVIQRLAEIGETAGGGFSWFSPPESIPDHQRERAPAGLFNLGVAHGVPAVISLLGECASAGVLPDAHRPMLDHAVDWLLAQKKEGKGWCFPAWVAEGVKPFPTRVAWCYGDPGVAAALFTAARHAGRATWEAEALDTARRAAGRRGGSDHTGVLDAGLCHGSAGLAHLFNRMYQASGDVELAEAARGWIRHALELRKPGEGVAGFSAWASEDPDVEKWEPSPGFLVGAAGIGLALLAAVTPLEPAWDRALAISVPVEPPTARAATA